MTTIYPKKRYNITSELALALNGTPASGRWDWSPRISWFLDWIPSFQKKYHFIGKT